MSRMKKKPIILNIQIATLLRSRETSVLNVHFLCELNLYPGAQNYFTEKIVLSSSCSQVTTDLILVSECL